MDTTGIKRVQHNIEGAIGQWNKVVSNFEASKFEHNTEIGFTGDESIISKVTPKSRGRSEDGKKAKNFIAMNMQNLKKKNNNLEADIVVPVQLNRRHIQVNSRNEPKTKVITLEKNLNVSNASELESMKTEMENLNNNMKQLNDNFKRVTAELSDEKKNNITLMNSLTATVQKYENLDHKIQEENSYKEQLHKISKELKYVLGEKNDILHRLENSKTKLAKAYKDMDSLKQEYHYKLAENAEKLKALEEDSHRWNKNQIKMENLIAECQKALNRKEEYIKHQDFVINNLELETKLSKESVSDAQRYIAGKLVDTMVEDIEVSHNKGISGMRNRPEKAIAAKTRMDHKPDMEFDLSR